MITPLSDALSERGYDTLTPVQEAVIAPELAGLDLLVSAQTGSGKTVGFGLAIAPTLLGDETRFGPAAAPLALVVAPTRELAFQVMRELTWLFARTGAVVASCVGGMDVRQERRALERGAHIVVGTPGRLRDHIERESLDLSAIRAVVLDEADEMLDLGFREDLEFMLGEAPEDRRTLLFSATVPPMIATLAKSYQRDARRVNTVDSASQHADISYQAIRVAQSDVEHAIFNLLRFHDDESAIVFANPRAAVSRLTARLANRGLATVSLSGELSQTERSHALQAMRDGRARVCVATDVAARGIDLPNLNLVIHADLPTNTETLLHRSGRTGRAGRKGISALIVPSKVAKKAERLLKWAKISAEWTVAPSVDDIQRKDEERLLADPVWSEPLTEEQGAFAEKLLALHQPEVIAAAYLRLYQARHAAAEELLPPDTKPAAREPRDFGPSRWVTLSVGRDNRAEARWLLPLLCRAGNLDKASIGAIRVQDSETFVELAEPSVEGFVASLGEGGLLEEGISARLVEGVPAFSAGRPPKGDSRGPRPEGRDPRRDDRGPRKPREASASAAPSEEMAPRVEGPVSDDAPERKPRPAPKADAPRRDDRPAYKRDGAPARERSSDGPRDKGKFGKPKSDKPRDGGFGKPKSDKPYGKDKPRDGGYSKDKPREGGYGKDKPRDGGFGKPKSDKARDGGFGKPKRDGKPGGKTGDGARKPAGKFGDRPGKFGDSKPKGKSAGPAPDARDASRRFTPPGGAKPGARTPRKPGAGGNEPPRRGKR
ncbi:MAG: ATP-dependent RNA helicase [Yangia sp.]|nr:ATP-dependent RNA helicase [Salipiger sp.]